MRFLILLISICSIQSLVSQVLLDADGAGNTYSLITSVLAPGYNPIETPDCQHPDFGDHITEEFDDLLNAYVFRFHIHTENDSDRCIKFDRQRNEIKSYDKSPDNLLGIQNETVIYKWKFKLNSGFQSSPNFTHIHQLKSVGGTLQSMPMYTLTTRKSNPDRIELRYAQTNSQVTLLQTDLAPFIGNWLSVTETIKYGNSGTYHIEIKRINDDAILMEYTNNAIVNWRAGADFVRPKWGIYRSLLNAQDLRDEIISFANFSIQEVSTAATNNLQVTSNEFYVVLKPQKKKILLMNLNDKINAIQLFSIDGRRIVDKNINSKKQIDLDVSSIPNGIYIITASGGNVYQTQQVIIYK